MWIDPDPNSESVRARSLIGHLLGGRYLLERKLGSGGMGVVYAASDQQIVGEVFAVKILKPELQAHPEALSLLREEVRTTRALRHPNIVGVYSLNSDGSHTFMLMEYLEGKSLDALLCEEFGRGMSLGRAWPFILDICGALSYAHDHNVIHSDLKPSNVFVTLSGRAKLLDFGISRVARTRNGRLDMSGVGALTLAYASCEMSEGANPDQRDDVYSLGCLIYEMLTGTHPFESNSALEARRRHERVAPVAGLSASQNAALTRSLAFSRKERTPTVEVLLAELEFTLGGVATAGRVPAATLIRDPRAPPTKPLTIPVEESPRIGLSQRRILAAAIILLLLAAATIAGLKIFPAREHVTAAIAPPLEGSSSRPPNESAAPRETDTAAYSESSSDSTGVAPVAVAATTANLAPARAATAEMSDASPDRAPPQRLATAIPNLAPSPAARSSKSASRNDASQRDGAGPDIEARPVNENASPPPPSAHVPSIMPLSESQSGIDSCPYPPQALQDGQTGSVGLLVFVAPDGSVREARVDQSSGSTILDEAAASCIQANARFGPKRLGTKAQGYWGRTRFNWSFGG